MKKLILFLIRKRLKLRKYEPFQFTNQKSKTDYYWFTDTHLRKWCDGEITNAHVSLNWLLDDRCETMSYDVFKSLKSLNSASISSERLSSELRILGDRICNG